MREPTPTVSEIVHRAVEICDPQDKDPDLGHLEEQLEDDDEPVTAVDNLEERLAIAAEGVDFAGDNPAVSVAEAVVLYLADHLRAEDTDPDELIRLAVRRQWHGSPPTAVDDWVATH